MSIEATHNNIVTVFNNEVYKDLFTVEDVANILTSLETRIPLNVVIHGVRDREVNSISYTCPICKTHISRSKYCPNCGQALNFVGVEINDC